MMPEKDTLRSSRDEPLKAAWPLRVFVGYYRRPLLGYLLLFGMSAIWIFTPRRPGSVGLIVFTFPWLLFGLAILNLPLLHAASQRLTAPLPVRRNHALEHGTIQMLLRTYGTTKGISGKAAPSGFRVAGAKNQDDIERAFADFLALPQGERLELAVADRCGSMPIIAQGLGVLLLLATLCTVAVWRPQPSEAGILLGAQFLLFILGRRPLGRFLQAKRLLALDFPSARIQRIDKVEPDLFETPPVFFVRTEIIPSPTSDPIPGDQ